MTPLAQRVARDMLSLRKDRTFIGEAEEWVCQHMFGAHFFDVSKVVPLAHELVRSCEGASEALSELAFLPAPITWLEFRQTDGARGALMAAQVADDEAVVLAVDGRDFYVVPVGFIYTAPDCHSAAGMPFKVVMGADEKFAEEAISTVYGLLNLINRPGSLDRREHAPHRGLQRDLTRRAMVGRFPLRGWTEITLNVAPGGNQREPKSAGSTGDKCLHFVRAHRRRCYGVWVQIPAHWKGDPALGIKQTRYRVVPPRKAA